MDIFSKSISDFFSKKFLTLSFAPLFVVLVLSLLVLFLSGGEVLRILQIALLDDGKLISDFPLIAKILSFAAVHYVITILFYLFGVFLAAVLSVVIGILILGFLTPTVVKTVHKRYYSEYKLQATGTLKTFSVTLLTLLKFVLLLILAIPFMFIPILNIVAFNVPFFYLFYKLLTFDVISNIIDEKSAEELLKPVKFNILLLSFLFYMLALIPLVGLFLYLFFALYLTHYIFTLLIKK
ncbi:MAG: EI24 domain-containing protein [Campylobacteraceae bacterium]|jgi:hypothetical protein|nr:EI24 domain-containing protein [Campylobacteraceae bacterium]